MTSRDEQETTITFMRDDALVRVYTSNLPHVRRLRKLSETHDFVSELRGGTDWGEFTVSAENFRLFTAIRAKRVMSDVERATRADRMRRVRLETTGAGGS